MLVPSLTIKMNEMKPLFLPLSKIIPHVQPTRKPCVNVHFKSFQISSRNKSCCQTFKQPNLSISLWFRFQIPVLPQPHSQICTNTYSEFTHAISSQTFINTINWLSFASSKTQFKSNTDRKQEMHGNVKGSVEQRTSEAEHWLEIMETLCTNGSAKGGVLLRLSRHLRRHEAWGCCCFLLVCNLV